MCGICGFYGFSDEGLLKDMMSALIHRGPDDEGSFVGEEISLGHRRLSIIDLNTGQQPIHNEDESIWVVFNGEIYNFRNLRRTLENAGHRFYTETDTEVIVHCYEEYGDFFADKLEGMFAFAIWDGDKRRLLLARDRVGIKPIYYYKIDSKFLFASEIKSILQYGEISREVNRRALDRYLSLRYVPGPETMFRGIMKLPPAHFLILGKNGFRINKYWELKRGAPKSSDPIHYIAEYQKLLRESIRGHLISDVPLGVYLSGGMDSSSMVALMSSMLDEPVRTFTIGFGSREDPLNEVIYAENIAEHFGTEHHEFIVEPNAIELLPELIWHMDEPLADETNIPAYLISKLAKEYVTVILLGEGADELFGSYAHEKTMVLGERYIHPLPGIIKSLPSVLARRVPIAVLDVFFDYPSSIGEKGKKRFIEFLSSLKERDRSYSLLVAVFDDDEKQQLLKDNAEPIRDFFRPFFSDGELAEQMLSVDTNHWLPDYQLLRSDKMTMAHAIEGRVPYLDRSLLEFSVGIPLQLKIRGFTEKYIARRAMKGILPEWVLRRKKRPFITPITQWGEKQLLEVTSQLLDKPQIGKYIDTSMVRKIFQYYPRSKLIAGRQLWTLITLELWHRIFIAQDNMKNPRLDIDEL